MKLKNLLWVVCVTLLLTLQSGADQSGTREALINSTNTSYVYAIDEYYTLVIPKYNLIQGGVIDEAFVKDFRAICPAELDRI